MKIVVAMDSFKGSLSAVRACDIVADSIGSIIPRAEIVAKPMADGGEGTAEALMAARDGEWVKQMVMGPLPDKRTAAGFAWFAGESIAVVEMAAASGLQLLSPQSQNPLKTTTYGTGQLIDAAMRHGAQRILLGVGGSATVDGGVGGATALGWKFLRNDGVEIGLGGGQLRLIDRVIPPPQRISAGVEVLCDVDSPLCGEHGAARVYGPQKGATEEMVEALEAGLGHLAELVRAQLGRDIRDLPGAGAAGGLAAGAVAFMDARLTSGIETVISWSGLAESIGEADWVITGEGSFDQQSLRGKVVSGVARVARQGRAKVVVLAGQVRVEPAEYHNLGIVDALGCMNERMALQYAMANSEELLRQAAATLAAKHLAGGSETIDSSSP